MSYWGGGGYGGMRPRMPYGGRGGPRGMMGGGGFGMVPLNAPPSFRGRGGARGPRPPPRGGGE